MSMLFRSVLSSALRMALPLAVGLPLVLLGRKSIRSRTLITIQKLMMAGMLLSLVLTFMGPLVQVPVSNQLPVPQISPALPALSEQPTILPEAVAGGQVPSGAVPVLSPWEIMDVLWLCGAVTLFFLTLIQNMRFFHRVSQNSSPAPVDLSDVVLFQGRNIGLRVAPRVRISAEVSTPMAVGYFRPVIFLPVRVLLFAPEEQQLLLSHELYHCKTKDNFWRLFSSILLAVYWFDPLVWVLARSFSTQSELCCDENVLSNASVQTRKLYGKLILSFVVKQPDYKQPVLSLQSGWKETFRGFKLRIGQIVSLEQKIPGKIFLIGCIPIFLLFSGMIGFSQESFTPFGGIILPDNPMGFVKAGIHVSPQKTFPISPPISDAQMYQSDFYDRDGNLSRDNLYFMTNEPHPKVVSGCTGVVAAVQTELPSDAPGISNDLLGELEPLGKFVIIDCGDGVTVRYTCLDMVAVKVGERVFAGDFIGSAGNSGIPDGLPDRCGVFVMQDGLMVDPLPFFDVSAEPAVYPIETE